MKPEVHYLVDKRNRVLWWDSRDGIPEEMRGSFEGFCVKKREGKLYLCHWDGGREIGEIADKSHSEIDRVLRSWRKHMWSRPKD